MSAVSQRWLALRRPLNFAAKDRFRHLEEIKDLGPSLQKAASALAEAVSGDLVDQLRGYAEELQSFAEGDRDRKIRLVALGLRLCAMLPEEQREEPRPVAQPQEPPGLASPLTVLKGVGPALARRLAGRGLQSVEDLLYFLPLDYEDRRSVESLSSLSPGMRCTTRGVVVKVKERRARGRRMLEIGLAEGPEGKPLLWGVWFRAHPGLTEQFPTGKRILVSGEVRDYRGALQIVHPDVCDDSGQEEGAGLRCRYPEVEGVAPRLLQRLCDQACRRFASEVPDGVPSSVARELPAQAEAIRQLHLVDYVPDEQELGELRRGEHPAHRRLVFDELFSLQLAVGLRRARWDDRRALSCRISDEEQARLLACFPFALTTAQKRVLAEILSDLGRPRPMHRLLQGDVGSGKTAVAFAAAAAAMASGLQAAIMAPTELLARQHFSVMEPWCRELGRRAALLTASTPRGARESLLALADAGAMHLFVGTHALLSARLQMPNLGLVVVDEQHRFGVVQRTRLRDRDEERPLPHLLVMTATPIPRTLALALYGDLDLSLLDEKPPGRLPPTTLLFLSDERERAYARVEEQLAQGQQAFVVCPLVEESEKLQVADAVGTAKRLKERFARRRIGLVHGRLPPRERDLVMDAFRRRELDLLVATTVIEVGIDVPRANVMVVEHAERFGLAQLHQLRGRVGRGEEASFCLLLSEAPGSSIASERLHTMVQTCDGFEIAEADLRLRGPGEVFGTRQSGLPRLRFADLRQHMQLLAEAQKAALAVLERDPSLSLLEHAHAREVMEHRWEGLSLVGEEAG